MSITHFFCITLFIFAGNEKILCQEAKISQISCFPDSVETKAMAVYFDTVNNDGKGFHPYVFFYRFLKDEKRDCFCSLLLFAKAFDFLLYDGLDLQYDPVKNHPVNLSVGSVGEKEQELDKKLIQAERLKSKKYWKYLHFLEIKSEYERQVVAKYTKENRSLEQDVNNLLRFGTYVSPVQLRDILMSKYAHITEKKIPLPAGFSKN